MLFAVCSQKGALLNVDSALNRFAPVSAYILNLNGLLPADARLDAKTLPAVKMPNRDMFVGDPRPDVKNPNA